MRELPRSSFVLCLTIVAAFAPGLAAQPPISEDVAVPGGTAAVAEILGIDPTPERARFVGEITRLAYDISLGRGGLNDGRIARMNALAASSSENGSASDVVPVPLSAAIWGQAIFHRQLAGHTLLAAILSDRDASLLCHGLAGLDDETLAFMAAHPALLTRLHERSAAAFSAFAQHIHVRGGRLVPPGGGAAVPLWEAIAGSTADPERFMRELFELHEGRVAYLYDTIGSVDQRRQAFALGLWIADPRARVDRFKALVAATENAYHDWRIRTYPFSRPLSDLAMLLARAQVDDAGRPVLPARSFWSRAFDIGSDAEEAKLPVDAAWLADAIISRDLQERTDRLDQYAFGVRVFASAGESEMEAAADAVRAFPHSRMLMLSLERIGIAAPSTYVEAARRAHQLGSIAGERGFVALAQFQGALALVVRLARVRAVDAAALAPLVDSLIAAHLSDDGEYAGAIVEWLNASLHPLLASAPAIDAAVSAALAGRKAASHRSIPWEGQQYRLDLAAAELRRLSRIRAKQGAYTLDVATDVWNAARKVGVASLSADDLESTRGALAAISETLPPKAAPTVSAPGVGEPRSVREIVDRAAKDLTHANATDSSKRAAIAKQLMEAADRVAAEALISLAYAVDIGDADSPVLLAGNAALRHDFGLTLRDSAARARVAWSMPKADVSPQTPWRIRGSALGLDLGLSSLALRRINADHVVGPPSLSSNERDAFAASLAMMNPFALRDEDRDAMVETMRRGRTRASALTAATFDAAAESAGLDGWRIRAGRWMLAHDGAGEVATLFSAGELLRLGGASTSNEEWGMSGVALSGCLCLRLTPPGMWTMWTGRPQLGLIAANVADLNLRVAEMLADLGLPAALARYVLAAAVQDFIDESKPTDPNDWLTLVRSAQRIARDRLEDYVASAAAVDGPLLPEPSSRPH